jgi:hypothetical protein
MFPGITTFEEQFASSSVFPQEACDGTYTAAELAPGGGDRWKWLPGVSTVNVSRATVRDGFALHYSNRGIIIEVAETPRSSELDLVVALVGRARTG